MLRFNVLELTLPPGTPLSAADEDSPAPPDTCAVLVQMLLEYRADVSVCNREGRSALHSALLCGQAAAASLLLAAGADPNVRDTQAGSLALHYACMGLGAGQAALLKALVKAGTARPVKPGAYVDERKGKSRTQKLLLQLEDILDDGLKDVLCPQAIRDKQCSGSDIVNYRTDAGLSALHYACGATDTFEFPLHAVNDDDEQPGHGVGNGPHDERQATDAPQQHEAPEMVRFLVAQPGADVNALAVTGGVNALHFACATPIQHWAGGEADAVGVVTALLSAGVGLNDVEMPGGVPVGSGGAFAAAAGSGQMRFSPLHYAVSGNRKSMLAELLLNEPDCLTDPPGANPPALLVACQAGMPVNVVKAMLARAAEQRQGNGAKGSELDLGVTLNTTTGVVGAMQGASQRMWSGSALHLAAEFGHVELVSFLVGVNGIDLNLPRAVDTRTALHLACFHGHAACAKVLVEQGHADITAMDEQGEVPLLSAVRANQAKVVRYLLSPKFTEEERNDPSLGVDVTSSIQQHLHTDWGGIDPSSVMEVAEQRNMAIVDGEDELLTSSGGQDEARLRNIAHSNTIVQILLDKVPSKGMRHIHECYAQGILYQEWLQQQQNRHEQVQQVAAGSVEGAGSDGGTRTDEATSAQPVPTNDGMTLSAAAETGSTEGNGLDNNSEEAEPVNEAFVFVKPHACNEEVITLVRQGLDAAGIEVSAEGSLEAEQIDERKLIDTHYGAIASKAVALQPKELQVSEDAKSSFRAAFGLSWEDALQQELVYNAQGACEKLGVDALELDHQWSGLQRKGAERKLIKFGGGFYCGKLRSDFYAINGFYMAMRRKYTLPPARIHFFVARWKPASKGLSWKKFRAHIVGPTDPRDAPPTSLRGQIYSNWQRLGLPSEPDTGDNGVHASAGPLEGLAERLNWLGEQVHADAFGQKLLGAGITADMVQQFITDPQVQIGEKEPGSLFDAAEDLDATDCVDLLAQAQLA